MRKVKKMKKCSNEQYDWYDRGECICPMCEERKCFEQIEDGYAMCGNCGHKWRFDLGFEDAETMKDKIRTDFHKEILRNENQDPLKNY